MKTKKILLIFILILLMKLISATNNVDTVNRWEEALTESRYSHYSKSNEIISIKLKEGIVYIESLNNLKKTNSQYKNKVLWEDLQGYKMFLLYRTNAINCYNLGKYKQAYEAINKALNIRKNNDNIDLMMLKFLTENIVEIKSSNHNKLKNNLLSYVSTKTSYNRFFYFLLSRYFLFRNDIKKSSIAIKKSMLQHKMRKIGDNSIPKEIYLLYDFLQYLQGENISNTELENLSKIDDCFSEVTNANYYYFKSIISFDKGDMEMAKKKFIKADKLIKEKKMEYNYKMDNLYNIFTKEYRNKLQKIEKMAKK